MSLREKGTGYLKAATHFKVLRTTLFRFVNARDPIESMANIIIRLGKDIERQCLRTY